MKQLRHIAAFLLLVAPLGAYPLVFAGKFAGRHFSAVEMVTPGVLGVFALGIVLAFPEKLIALCRDRSIWQRLCVLLATLFIFWSLTRSLAGDAWQKFASSLFYTVLPLACIAVGEELKKMLPGALLAYGMLALVYGIFSPHGEGLLLNWNWNSTFVKLGIAALAVRLFPRYPKKIILAASLLFAVDLAIEFFWRGNYFSCGSWIAFAAATLVQALPAHLFRRHSALVFATAVTFSALFFILPEFFPQSRDCRVQLWRGTRTMIVQHFATGVGVGNFEDKIQEKLPLEYYFGSFLAPRHPHPHNETLFFLAAFGVTGGLFLAVLLAAAARNDDAATPVRLLQWGVWLLFFHGSVDVLLAEPLPGVLFYACAGALIAPAAPPSETGRQGRELLFIFMTAGAAALAGRALAGSYFYRQAAAYFRQGSSCQIQIRRALLCRTDARTLYLAGWEALRTGNFAAAEKFFERICCDLHSGGYLHSNRLAGIAAMEQGKYRQSADLFAREERRYPVSVANAHAMAYLAGKIAAPPEFQQAANQKVLDLLALRGRSIADLADFLRGSLDDTLPCIKCAVPAPVPPSKK